MENLTSFYQGDVRFLSLLRNEGGFQTFSAEFKAFHDQLINSDGDGVDMARLAVAMVSLRQLATTFLRCEVASQQIRQEVAQETAKVFEIHLDEQRATSHGTGKVDDTSALRRFFLDNIAEPYPDQQQKEDLAAQTNRLLAKPNFTDTKVQTWFINMRRRSGYSTFLKVFAKHGDVDGGKARINMRRLIAAIKAQEDVPPPGVQDRLAALMIELNVTTDVEAVVARLRNEDDPAKHRRNKSQESKPQPPPRRKHPARADPTGAIRARVCRKLYAEIVEMVSCSVKDRVSPWFNDVLKSIKQLRPPKNDARRASSSTALQPSSPSLSRAVAPLPKRSTNRLVDHIPSKGRVPSSSSSRRSATQNSSSPASLEFPSVLRKLPSSRKAAILPGSEAGPRLPSVLQTSHIPTSSADFWQNRVGSNANLTPAVSDFSSFLPLSIPSIPSSQPAGLNIGFSAAHRNVSSQSAMSSSSVAESAYTGFGSSVGSGSMSSSQASMASLMGSVGMSEPDLVCSSASEAGTSLDGWQSTPSDLDMGFASFPGSSTLNSPRFSSPAPVVDHNPFAPPSLASSSGKRNRICSEDDGAAENSQESAKKRNRAGRRPRHTDGGAPSSLITQASSAYTTAPVTPMVCSSPDFPALASASLPMPIPGADLNLGLPPLPQYPHQMQVQPQHQQHLQQLQPYMMDPSLQMSSDPAAALSAKAMEMAAMAWCYSAMAQNFSAISQVWNPQQQQQQQHQMNGMPSAAAASATAHQQAQRYAEFQGPTFAHAPHSL